jgi:hypothetical protein
MNLKGDHVADPKHAFFHFLKVRVNNRHVDVALKNLPRPEMIDFRMDTG